MPRPKERTQRRCASRRALHRERADLTSVVMTTVLRELDRCLFCDGTDMTEEHLIADWAHRAFARKRKPDSSLRGAFVGPGRLRLDDGDATATAKVICRECNNQWLSQIDNDAAKVLRPLIRGEREVALDRAAQDAVAAWIYKTALIFDAAEHGHDGPLASLRPIFRASRKAGPGCVIWAGPASTPPSLAVGTPPTTVNLWMLGVRPANGTILLAGNIDNQDGTITPGTPTIIPIPGYQIMVGALWAYLGGPVPPVASESLRGFEQVWPARDETVRLRAASLVTHDETA